MTPMLTSRFIWRWLKICLCSFRLTTIFYTIFNLTITRKILKRRARLLKKQTKRKSARTARGYLRDECRDFAILHSFPQCYQEILELITANSDDKFVERKGIYKIKTLPYHSKNANWLFCRFDSVMKDAAGQKPLAKMFRGRTRRLPKKPEMSKFKLATKGLSIDFYSPKWYHKLLPNLYSQKLKDKLADSTFTKKYWEVLAEPYGLVGPGSSDEEESASKDGDLDGEGEGIDLTQPSPNASKNEFLEEGDTGSLYGDEEDSEFIALDDEEEEVEGGGSDNKEDDEYDKAQDNIVMKTIPKWEEEW
ncbi:hypothetical protein VP01_4273g2 [Puccinia sorghi]|uniref:Uncharacterized protein n=1 Tax=Puccinia sorghi TaxID=27349 RepID=A0A0L6UQA9_9BASI|nr:hypothetical protein VP01_4273g2 [Puccinia sorghi]